MKIAFDNAELERQLGATVAKLRAAARPAAQAGAQIVYDTARALAPVSKAAHMFNIEGRVYGPFLPGNLRDSIYQVFSKSESNDHKAAYQVSWNFSKAPYGFTQEYGTSKTPAQSFIGRAMREQGKAALQAIEQRYIAEVSK